ncbi:MAG TPA: Fe-S cluster assembly protein SufD [Verrucomicrobiae bacterium]
MAKTVEKPSVGTTESHLEKFERFEREAQQPGWVFPLRKAGVSRFAEQGFPTLQDEDWRFTNVGAIAKLPFKPVFQAPARHGIKPEDLARFTFGSLAAHRLVFINGHFAPELSSPAPVGFTAESLAGAMAVNSSLLQDNFGRQAQTDNSPFTSLNTAFFQDGAFIHIPAGRAVETPIHLLHIATLKESGATASPRNLILVEQQSRATILESYVSTAQAASFTNTVSEVVVGDGAVFEHCKFQDESAGAFHISALHARLGSGSNFISHSIATGAKLSRNNIRTVLAGEGLDCVLNGLYLTRGDQLADHHMVVEHAQPHCNSHEYYNGILDGRSKGVFHGRILVRQAAQKTDAKQTNKNLLLSEDATVDTKPQLEIYADDVKCTHGATVGQLNEESVFYLRARGIGAETARRILIHAFAAEITERIRCAPAREELDRLLWERLEANPHVAEQR